MTKDAWSALLKTAYVIFDDCERRGFGRPPFALGGGTVLMFQYEHRLSKDIDLFGYDAQWLSLVSPRLNEVSAALTSEYVEQANSVKIVLAEGDIDFVIAADVIHPLTRQRMVLADREIAVDPCSEILAKKMFYRAATFQPRDVYDMSAAIDLDPVCATTAIDASASKRAILLQRLDVLRSVPTPDLLSGIVPYDGPLRHGAGMVEKVFDAIAGRVRPNGFGSR